MKKLFIKTYGCQMNVYDSERMAELLAPHGYATTDRPAEADLVILNTCHIREKATEKVYSDLGRIKQVQQRRLDAGDRRPMRVAVAGCVAQAEGAEIQRRAANVDVVVGPQTYHRLPELLSRVNRRPVDTDFPVESKFDHLPQSRSASGVAAFLSIQEGCDKFCTFCVVPYTRGTEQSRPVTAVAAEAETLVAGGVREITLLGQNVNAYHGTGPDGTDWSLAQLIGHLADIGGLERIRYTTSHPSDVTEDLIAVHRDVPELMPYLHLPVQSGADSVLAAMNRRYSADDYRRVVGRLRAARPDLALSSDFIVGFPGETDADFQATLALVGDIEFAQAFSFKYSARPGTPAAGLAHQVAEPVKVERLARLQALLADQQRAFNRATVGTSLPILLDKTGRHDGQLVGRSPYLQAVHLDGAGHAIGDMVRATIVGAKANSLSAEIDLPADRRRTQPPVDGMVGNPA